MIDELDYTYHSHTARCGHAYGKDEDYVEAAIKRGLKVLGFSDHVFLPGLSQYRMRGDYEEMDDYVSSVRSLEKKYKDKKMILRFIKPAPACTGHESYRGSPPGHAGGRHLTRSR